MTLSSSSGVAILSKKKGIYFAGMPAVHKEAPADGEEFGSKLDAVVRI